MEGKFNSIKRKLEAKGYRISRIRKELIKLFLNSKKHLNVKEIYDILRDKDISMASIYRNIEILKNNDIIKEIIIDNIKYYELNMYSQKCIHLHFTCEECGKIIDVYNDNISIKLIEIIHKLEKNNQFQIEDFVGVIRGVCLDCKGR